MKLTDSEAKGRGTPERDVGLGRSARARRFRRSEQPQALRRARGTTDGTWAKKVQPLEMLLHREWKDVVLTQTWMRGRTSGGTNLPAAEAGVRGWCERKCSDTGLLIIRFCA